MKKVYLCAIFIFGTYLALSSNNLSAQEVKSTSIKDNQKKGESMLDKIHWLGHDSFRIEGEKIIYIDPWKLKNAPKADFILITHDHYDHCSPSDVAAIQKPTTEIICVKDSKSKLSGRLNIVTPGTKLSFPGLEVEAVPAYNIGKKFHPKANNWVGYIITLNGVRIYHAGDTDLIPEMKNFKCDIALIPVSGTYVMTAEEAVEAVRTIKPKQAIPMHWGDIVGSLKEAEYFKAHAPCEVVIKKKE
jgi:L-ascorbate metabolism protein UlaG (beta-lactamase superfamily)